MLRDALTLQVDPEPICSLSANTKNDSAHPASLEVGGEGAQSVLRDRMTPAAFAHPYAAMHRKKFSNLDP